MLQKEGPAGDAASPQNRLQVAKALIHSADISPPAKMLKTHVEWTDRVMQEFYDQAAQELANGKAKASLPTRGSVVLGKFQLGFIGWIRPLFAKIAALPSVNYDAAVQHLEGSKAHWIAETAPKPADALPVVNS